MTTTPDDRADYTAGVSHDDESALPTDTELQHGEFYLNEDDDVFVFHGGRDWCMVALYPADIDVERSKLLITHAAVSSSTWRLLSPISQYKFPPAPPEPRNLGAVVEDAKGRRWVQCASADEKFWQHDQGGYGYPGLRATWVNIPKPVTILSEGVPE